MCQTLPLQGSIKYHTRSKDVSRACHASLTACAMQLWPKMGKVIVEGVNIGVSDTCMKLSCSTGLTGQEGKMARPACCLWSVTGCISLRRVVQECIEVEGLGCPKSAQQARTVQLTALWLESASGSASMILTAPYTPVYQLSCGSMMQLQVRALVPCPRGKTPPTSTDRCLVHAQVQPGFLKSQQVPATAADL